jgi:HEAT repeat protein
VTSSSGNLGASEGAQDTPVDPSGGLPWRANALAALRHAFPDSDVEVFTGCAVALGKAGDATDAPALLRALGQSYGDQSMRESLVLGLGLLGRGAPGARAALAEVLRNRKEPSRIRGMAAIALGLSRDAAAAPLLLSTARERGPSKDPAASTLIGVGLLGEPLVIPDLVAILDDPASADTKGVRPQAAYALGRIGGAEAVRGLGRALGDSDPQVRRAAILALGECAPADVAPLAAALAHGVREDRDRACRNFASVVLGRIGGVDALDALSRRFALGDRGERDFATLGLGLWARGTTDADAKARISASLRSDFQNRDDADYRGALAIALGLMRDQKAIPNLRSVVKERGDPDLRAHCALALGLVGAKVAEADLRACLVEKGNPVLQREAALALGLLGDPSAAKVLADLLSGPGVPEHVRASAARALGNIGGEVAAQALDALLASPSASGAVRGQAAVGLGLILDRRQPGALASIPGGLDFLAPSPAILEVLTIP